MGLFSYFSHGQQYRAALGIKGDWSSLDLALAQLSVKHFFYGPNAFEYNVGFGRRYLWTQITYHRNQTLRKDIDWYWGTGIDWGYWNSNYDRAYDSDERSGFWGGINGVLGLEYTFDFIPINLAIDTGPTLRVVPNVKFGWMAGFALRYGFR